jgi:hypothetical protein
MTELGRFEIALAPDSISLSASVTPAHRTLLVSYRMNAHRGEDSARDLIIRDLRNFLDLGALDRATDLLIVLALYMRETARCNRRLLFATRVHRDAIALRRGRAAHAHYAVAKARGELPALRTSAPESATTVEGEEKL